MEEKSNEKKRPQYKFLSDMYDDFFWLISSDPDAFEAAQNSLKKRYNHRNSEDFEMKSRDEYLKAAKEREEKNRKEKQNSETPPTLEGILEEKKAKKADSKTSTKDNTTDNSVNAQKLEKVIESINNKTQNNISNAEIQAQAEERKKKKLDEFFEKVDNAHLTDESKIVLKKMIDYARKYNSGIVKNYIPFNMRIYGNDYEIINSIIDIIVESFTYFSYLKNANYCEKSFFAIDDVHTLTSLYTKDNSLVIVKDVKGLSNQDKALKDKLLNTFEEIICETSNVDGITTIITDTDRAKIDDVFSNSPTLKDKIFDFELETTSSNTQEIYQNILKSFKNDYVVSGEFEVKLLDYINETLNKTDLNSTEYTNALVEKILFNQTGNVIDSAAIPSFERNKSIEEIFEELNGLVGLDNVKQMLNDLVSLMKFKSKTEGNIKLKNTNLHMVFLGNPGTGKTTVARMVAGILYNLSYIKQNKLLEVSAKDLVGQYVGQTAQKTISVIEKALGGVLFIDEAYSLASKPGSTGNSFNEECVATLIQAMENYRDNLVVIFAGYSKEMDVFLKSNSGIVSRIGYTLEFKDYTVPELISIFKSMFRKAGFSLKNDAIEKAREIIEEYKQTENFGNARFVRNLYEKTIIKHATNTQNQTSKQVLKTITADDISTDNLLKL